MRFHWKTSVAASGSNQGADVRGYIACSFIDTFEWQAGYSRSYGLIHIDYATQQRIFKDSARWYQQVFASIGERVAAMARRARRPLRRRNPTT